MGPESLQNSPGSSLMGGSCSLRGAHSMPLPMHAQPSPQGPRLAPSVQVMLSSPSPLKCLLAPTESPQSPRIRLPRGFRL